MTETATSRFRDDEDIKVELRRRGHNCEALARANGVAPSVVRMSFVRTSRKGELIIAKALRLRPHEVWPDRWNADGTRKRDGRRKHSRAAPPTHRQIATAS